MPIARDGYSEYFTEKLWEWVPAIHRELDATDGGDALRALIRAIATQAAKVKRSQDRLWDDMFVELADDWAVPYIAELVATRLVSSLNPRGRRADVAKTIYYRRRKGTLPVLEQLIADLTAWDGRVIEQFRRLARMRHGLDGPARVGRLTGTPEGGWADLRHVRGARLAGDPFDEFHYTPETRRPAGRLGLRGIATLGVYVYPLHSVEFRGVQPVRLNTPVGAFQGFTFDPSGRDVPLFAVTGPSRDWSAWRTAEEWSLPRQIDCRLLDEVAYRIGDAEIAWILNGAPIPNPADRLSAADNLRTIANQRFLSREVLPRLLRGLPQGATLGSAGVLTGILTRALEDDCGSAALLPDANGQSSVGPPAMQVGFLSSLPLPRDVTRAGDLSSWGVAVASALPGVQLHIDPARGRFVLDPAGQPVGDARVRYRVGMAIPAGSGASGREINPALATVSWQDGNSTAGTPANGIAQLEDSATYPTPPDQPALHDCTIRAAEGHRPYLRLTNPWRLTASGTGRALRLDGLWVGGAAGTDVHLDGDFDLVTLRYCTLDPGGTDALGNGLAPCRLVIHGLIEHLHLERCILPAIELATVAAELRQLSLVDCVIDATQPGVPGIAAPRSVVSLTRCTVIGSSLAAIALDVERLDATDSIIAAMADVTNLQEGCFRFSARGPGSRVPRPFASAEVLELPGLFASRRFGDPHYASLSPRAPEGLTHGSEEGGEMGVGCSLRNPVKAASLRTKLDEYLPFGRLPAILMEL